MTGTGAPRYGPGHTPEPGPLVPPPGEPHPEHETPTWLKGAVAALAALLVALTVWTLVDLSRDRRDEPAPAAAPTTSSTGPTPTPLDPAGVSSRTSEPPGPVERCGEYHLKRTFGDGVGIRDCAPDWALLFVPTGRTGLYRWSGERWEFFADPYSGQCREQLTGQGVPELMTRDFPPCDRGPTSSITPPPSSSAPAPSRIPEAPPGAVTTRDNEVIGPLGVTAPNGGSDPGLTRSTPGPR